LRTLDGRGGFGFRLPGGTARQGHPGQHGGRHGHDAGHSEPGRHRGGEVRPQFPWPDTDTMLDGIGYGLAQIRGA
jgi:hypothetical protein